MAAASAGVALGGLEGGIGLGGLGLGLGGHAIAAPIAVAKQVVVDVHVSTIY